MAFKFSTQSVCLVASITFLWLVGSVLCNNGNNGLSNSINIQSFKLQKYGGNQKSLHQIRSKRSILENLGLQRMLKDKAFVTSVINCVLERGPCDEHGSQLKRLAPDILRGRCPGCDRAAKNHMRRVMSHVQRNFPQEWNEVTHRFLVLIPQQQQQQLLLLQQQLLQQQQQIPSTTL